MHVSLIRLLSRKVRTPTGLKASTTSVSPLRKEEATKTKKKNVLSTAAAATAADAGATGMSSSDFAVPIIVGTAASTPRRPLVNVPSVPTSSASTVRASSSWSLTFDPQAEIPRRLLAKSVPRARNPTTNVPFDAAQRAVLDAAAVAHGYSTAFWFTLPQLRRTLGGRLRPGEVATVVRPPIAAVVPLEALPREQQAHLLAEHPPYADGGVGILRGPRDWIFSRSGRLAELLNPRHEQRRLFLAVPDTVLAAVEKDASKGGGGGVGEGNASRGDTGASELESATAQDPPFLGIPRGVLAAAVTSHRIDIGEHFPLALYNADQLEVPARGYPLRGIALDGKGARYPQPAHDTLVAFAAIRGYASPTWLSAYELRRCRLAVAAGREGEGVLASTMTGTAVPLSCLTAAAKEALQRLSSGPSSPRFGGHDPLTDGDHASPPLPAPAPASNPNANHANLSLFGCNGWERVRLRSMRDAMSLVGGGANASHNDSLHSLPTLWVCLEDAAVLLTEYRHRLRNHMHSKAASASSHHSARVDGALLADLGPLSSPWDLVALDDGPQQQPVPMVDLAAATQRTFYNAAVTERPHLAAAGLHYARPVAIGPDGQLFGRGAARRLQHHALVQRFTSPVWLTRNSARRLGVAVRPEELRRYFTLDGGTGILPTGGGALPAGQKEGDVAGSSRPAQQEAGGAVKPPGERLYLLTDLVDATATAHGDSGTSATTAAEAAAMADTTRTQPPKTSTFTSLRRQHVVLAPGDLWLPVRSAARTAAMDAYLVGEGARVPADAAPSTAAPLAEATTGAKGTGKTKRASAAATLLKKMKVAEAGQGLEPAGVPPLRRGDGNEPTQWVQWVPETEVLLRGWLPRPGAKLLDPTSSIHHIHRNERRSTTAPTTTGSGAGPAGRARGRGRIIPVAQRRWYNAAQTTDPAKVHGLTFLFRRSQHKGVSSANGRLP